MQDMKPNNWKAKTVALLYKGLRRCLRNERGGLLIEVVVTLSVFGILGTAVLGAVQTSNIAKARADIDATADNLIRNQISYIMEQPYKLPGETYDTVALPSGYTLDVDNLTHDVSSTDISMVRITVYHQGQEVEVHEELRANR